MTLRRVVSVSLFSTLAVTLALAAVATNDAHACGGYYGARTPDALIRGVVTTANVSQDALDRKAGSFVTRSISSVKRNLVRFGGPTTAVVHLDVAWNYERRTEIVTLVHQRGSWVITNRFQVRGVKRATQI